MDFIICPECGGEISADCDRCVKCGCKITCCPECKRVFKGYTESCPNCGYVFKKSAVKTDDKTLAAQAKEVKKRIDADVRVLKKFRIAQKVWEILTFAFLIAGAALYVVWTKKDGLEKLAELKKLNGDLKLLTAFFCSAFILALAADDVAGYLLRTRRGKWLQDFKFDYKAYIKKYNAFGLEGEEAKLYLDIIKETAFEMENVNEKWVSLALISAKIACLITLDICLTVWLTGNLGLWLQAEALEVKYSWQFGSAAFVIAVISLVATIAVDFIADIPQDKRRKKWCENLVK